ncbi:MAG: sigma-E factor negative regulatory protein [Thiotrichales bacterium]
MKHTQTETLSAAIDGELTPFETRQIVRDTLRDPKLAAKWSRYHLIGDAMRGELPTNYESELAKRISRRLALEGDNPRPATVSGDSSWARTLGGLAIAASVAAVSLLSLKLLTSNNNYTPGAVETAGVALQAPSAARPGTPTIAGIEVQPVSTIGASQGAAGNDAVGAAPTLRDPRLNSFLATHAEFAARSGLMARARIVGFDSPQE